ncbi:MAG: radical SAM mobile pair protein B [Butyrivibrio sp.]|nr:radical SAM mobile pair protein B [Acetatifactor muris]MCM1560913.1 radical SAM mobile pair protein B [Butyrivibrio sp.]
MEMVVNEIDVKSVLTKSNLPVADYSVNPYTGCSHACKYCYASFMKRFSKHPEPWGKFVDIKKWPEIKNSKRYAGKELFIGSVTDPYQPLEETYERTRVLLEQMQGSGCKISIATKSDLVLRDLDLIKAFPEARVSWSINTLDEAFRTDMDEAVNIERRLAAMKAFHDAGVRTTCFISPIFPEITDVPAIIRRAKDQCNLVWLENLNLRGGYKTVILDYITKKYPKLASVYEAIYQKGDRSYWKQLDEEMRRFTKEEGLLYVRDDDSIKRPFEEPTIVVNYFFHEEIIPSAKKAVKGSRKVAIDL